MESFSRWIGKDSIRFRSLCSKGIMNVHGCWRTGHCTLAIIYQTDWARILEPPRNFIKCLNISLKLRNMTWIIETPQPVGSLACISFARLEKLNTIALGRLNRVLFDKTSTQRCRQSWSLFCYATVRILKSKTTEEKNLWSYALRIKISSEFNSFLEIFHLTYNLSVPTVISIIWQKLLA